MLNIKEASKGILQKYVPMINQTFNRFFIVMFQSRFPSHVELEGSANFLGNMPLKDYGDAVSLADGPELYKLTDAFCLSAIKV